jgi:hypothetical protein
LIETEQGKKYGCQHKPAGSQGVGYVSKHSARHSTGKASNGEIGPLRKVRAGEIRMTNDEIRNKFQKSNFKAEKVEIHPCLISNLNFLLSAVAFICLRFGACDLGFPVPGRFGFRISGGPVVCLQPWRFP